MSSPRQILLLTEESGVGGVQTTLHWLESGLAERGWHVTRLPVRQGRPSWWACWQAARRAQVLVASNNFRPAYAAVALAWLARRPSVVWVHGPLHEVLQQAGASSFKTRWLRAVYQRASQLVCASQASCDSLLRVMAGAGGEAASAVQSRLSVIRNPAVLPGAGQDDATMPATEVIALGFVGRLSPEKQPLQLLPMLRLLPAACQLHVVGDGELMGAMRSAGQDLLAQGRLHLHGQQTVSAQTYRAWRATVLCSRYEGYPMTALESLACGVPCVSTPIPAMQEMLGTQAPLWLAHDESPAALAHAVQRCLAQAPAKRQAAIDLLQQQHRLETFVQAWDQVLTGLLQRLGKGSKQGPKQVLGQGHGAVPADASREDTPFRKAAVITVHFVHGARSYLPELVAYQAHIGHLGHAVQMHTQAHTVPDDARAVWWICGRVPAELALRFKGAVQVHEYASASVAPLAWLKDRIKQWQHPVPDFRVFQSEWVRQRMGFGGKAPGAVPYALRDMGVPDAFLTAQALQPPEFDLVYLGEMRRLLHFVPLLRTLGQAGLSLLLVGDVPLDLQERLAKLGHIQSTGRVPQDQVPAQLLRARAGLNLMPDVLPLSEQTSTKMLEYLALGLPVISNPYAWAQRTARAHAGRVQLLDVQATAAQWQAAVQGLPPQQTDRQHLQSLCWSQQLQALPVWAALFGAGR